MTDQKATGSALLMRRLPKSAVGLRLGRIDSKGDLILCEKIRFDRGFSAVETTLRRAAISGVVMVGAKIQNHFADVLDANGDLIETVTLDSGSYASLKNRWMRCKLETAA